jgi:hypothetical protein
MRKIDEQMMMLMMMMRALNGSSRHLAANRLDDENSLD